MLLTGCIDLNFFLCVRLCSLTNFEIGSYMNFVLKNEQGKLLKITRPVVLWLKEMVMMVFRKGSESNIKSDLGIWAKYLFKHAFKHFCSINAIILYLFHLHKLYKIKLNYKHLNALLFQFTAWKAHFFTSCFGKLQSLVLLRHYWGITELLTFKVIWTWLLHPSVKYVELLLYFRT